MTKRTMTIMAAMALATPVAAQLVPPPLAPGVDRVLGAVKHDVVNPATGFANTMVTRASMRLERLSAYVRANRASVERDDTGAPARRGVVLIVDADAGALDIARARGFRLVEKGTIAGTDIAFSRLETPRGRELAEAVRDLRKRLPRYEIAPDHLYFSSGAAGFAEIAVIGEVRGGAGEGDARVGMIDGGTSTAVAMARGFATGAPTASQHGTVVAALLTRNGASRIYSADVYGTDSAGGNALAIARAIGWMVEMRVGVVNVSLVGPPNPLLARSIAAARARGVAIVAAVGNDGPAAPPAYPASYPGVIAVTGVDAKRRPLIEAGRALHLDYAAPGVAGKFRGTSFATPVVAARLAVLDGSVARLDGEAIDLGPRGPDKQFGRGFICGICR